PAPVVDEVFRPEEEHRASGVDDVLPPAPGRHGAVIEPRRRFRTAGFDTEVETLLGLPALRLHRPATVEKRHDPEGVPGARGEVLDRADADAVRRGDARERRRHADALTVRLHDEHAA